MDPIADAGLRLVLLGGPPAVGKSTVAEALLHRFAGGSMLVQWVDVDTLWRHQPWSVGHAMVSMLHANLRAVLENAAAGGADVVVVSWVFQEPRFHDLVRSLAPEGVSVLRIRLVWEARIADRNVPPDHQAFYQRRYDESSSTPADHVVDTDHATVDEIAATVAALVRGWAR